MSFLFLVLAPLVLRVSFASLPSIGFPCLGRPDGQRLSATLEWFPILLGRTDWPLSAVTLEWVPRRALRRERGPQSGEHDIALFHSMSGTRFLAPPGVVMLPLLPQSSLIGSQFLLPLGTPCGLARRRGAGPPAVTATLAGLFGATCLGARSAQGLACPGPCCHCLVA